MHSSQTLEGVPRMLKTRDGVVYLATGADNKHFRFIRVYHIALEQFAILGARLDFQANAIYACSQARDTDRELRVPQQVLDIGLQSRCCVCDRAKNALPLEKGVNIVLLDWSDIL